MEVIGKGNLSKHEILILTELGKIKNCIVVINSNNEEDELQSTFFKFYNNTIYPHKDSIDRILKYSKSRNISLHDINVEITNKVSDLSRKDRDVFKFIYKSYENK